MPKTTNRTDFENLGSSELTIDRFEILNGKICGENIIPDETGEIKLSASLPANWHTKKYAVIDLKIDAKTKPEVLFGLTPDKHTAPILHLNYQVLQKSQVQLPIPIDENTLRMNFHFLPPRPGVFKGIICGKAVLPEQINTMILYIRGEELKQMSVPHIVLSDVWEPIDIVGQPLVDEFGQRKSGHWSGKTESLEELSAFLQSELEKAKTTQDYPEDWSKWGGWKKKRFTATGWFHKEHDGRRWWLVDPDGYAFFSNGMCYGNRTGIFSMADHLDSLFDRLPEKDGIMSQVWTTGDKIPQYVVRNGIEDAKTRLLVNFPRANMIRVFGEQWLDAWITINSARMRSMGINTLGVGVNDYDDEFTPEFLSKSKIPYVITLKYFPLTKQRIFRDFPDVFSSEYERLAEKMAREQLMSYRNDPYLIGYFVTNEPEWLSYDDVNLSEQLLGTDGCLESKRKLIEFLSEKYIYVSELNRAWNTDFYSFDDLLNKFTATKKTPLLQSDLNQFHQILVEKYCDTISQSLKDVAPHHLNLGMRYSSITPNKAQKVILNDLDCFDVFSFNRYGAEPVTPSRILAEYTDMPCVVGEWHIGAADSGLDVWGLYYAQTEKDRAQAISYYLEQSTTDSHLVGVHYFEYSDQPYLGRFDGECYNIGIIDVCNRPYPLVMQAYQDFAEKMYPMLDGQLKPRTEEIPIENMASRTKKRV